MTTSPLVLALTPFKSREDIAVFAETPIEKRIAVSSTYGGFR
jgi:hypothetical protein